MNVLITGGAGFIGSALIRFFINETDHRVLNLDNLTYAGNLESLASISSHGRYHFVQGNICDRDLVSKLFYEFKPAIVMHLAAESHVDRSICTPADFIQTNIVGTSVMLECAREYWEQLPSLRRGEADEADVAIQADCMPRCASLSVRTSRHCQEPGDPAIRGPYQDSFRFHHISTDEVYGSLGDTGLFTEETAYAPSSPYSASKASSDHLVRAWHRTYGMPVLITNSSNNYGPYQFPEKLIPLMILNSLEGKPLPIYGNGRQIRDWLHVEDHARALYTVVMKGEIGETYNIGGHNEKTNFEVVHTLCDLLDELRPNRANSLASYKDLITFVADRPGHDQRYAIDTSKIQNELDWSPQETFETGLRKTVAWYLANFEWCRHVQDGTYQRQRLGLFPIKEALRKR